MSIEIYYDQGENILYFRFVSSQYISIFQTHTDLSMLFFQQFYSVIISLLHHCEIYKSSINHSIYLHHAKTHGFINAFSSLCDARYIWSPASLCRSILSAKPLNISPSPENTRIYQCIFNSRLCKLYSASRIICSSPSIM